nr:immunoglobulin light chain junction region [Macaca mulatta]
CLQTKSSPYS